MMGRIKEKFRNWQKSRLADSIAQGNMLHLKNYFSNLPENVNDKIFDNHTALHLAAKRGFTELVDFLLTKGAVIDLTATGGNTALHLAAQEAQFSVCQMLLAAGANPALKNDGKISAIDLFALHGQSLLTLQCLKDEKETGFALHMAALGGQTDLVKTLIGQGVNIHSLGPDGMTPLQNAILSYPGKSMKDKINISTVLLASGAFPNTPERPPLHLATGSVKLTELLLASGANPGQKDGQGQIALHLAAAQGNIETVACLLKKYPIGINAQDHNGNTALHVAAFHSRGVKMLETLVLAGIDVDLKNTSGKTALDILPKCPENAEAVFFLSKSQKAPDKNEWSLKDESVIWQRIDEKKCYALAEIFNFETAHKTSIYKDLTVKASCTQPLNKIPFNELEAAHEMCAHLKKRIKP